MKEKISNSIGIVDGKIKNRTVIEMHKEKPHIRTEVVFLTPISEEGLEAYKGLMLAGKLKETIQATMDTVQDKIGEVFEADIESTYVSLKHIL